MYAVGPTTETFVSLKQCKLFSQSAAAKIRERFSGRAFNQNLALSKLTLNPKP